MWISCCFRNLGQDSAETQVMETLTHTLWDSGPDCRAQLVPKVSMQYMRKDKDQLICMSESKLVLWILLGLRNLTKIHFILTAIGTFLCIGCIWPQMEKIFSIFLEGKCFSKGSDSHRKFSLLSLPLENKVRIFQIEKAISLVEEASLSWADINKQKWFVSWCSVPSQTERHLMLPPRDFQPWCHPVKHQT